jgi:2-polyprenyl-3-methyl-5-hydroxy-6-metoxy-1,4-benzoquinol methylase
MNRQQRRAQRQPQHSLARYRAGVAAAPNDAKARNELACALLAHAKLAEASEHFAHALSLMPELFEQYGQIVAMLLQINPALRGCLARVASGPTSQLEAWLPPDDFSAIVRDPLFRTVLELAPLRDLALERFLTLIRRNFLHATRGAGVGSSEKAKVEFYCALARQCCLNEYVFAVEAEEQKQVEALQETVTANMAAGGAIPETSVLLFASYVPLASVPEGRRLLDRTWPSRVRAVLRQQLIEPEEERRYRDKIPRLTPIENSISRLVQDQYEQNPYPRWVASMSVGKPTTVEAYLRQLFPCSDFAQGSANQSSMNRHADILVAGCGTGQQSIATARRFMGAKVLAVDLSLSSLAYAKRMSDALGVRNLEYAHADILKLGSIGRSFDVIEASGVLHHMAEPLQGWRILLSLLRPGGFMNVGLYSRTGRQIIQGAREFAAEKGYPATTEGIRRLRQDILLTAHREVSNWSDYYTTSECRDLLFHVQEHHTTIPDIARFIDEQRLRFIGFHVPPHTAGAYRRRFSHDTSLTDLSAWTTFENENPYTFSSMYQFWVQKS